VSPARVGLTAGGVAVAALVVVLVIKIRQDPEGETARAGTEPAASERTPAATPTAPAPHRMTGPPDASPLPTPEEEAAARAQVESEHIRSPSHSPDILDNHLDAQPLKEARKAMQKGDYETALKASEAALAVEESSYGRMLAVMAACSLGNRAKAQAHADKLDDMRKARVAVRCQKFGIEIKGVKPVEQDR
jgi:hypothetical protein